MLAFWLSWHMSCAVSGTSKVTWTDTLPQAHARHYRYICITDPFLARKALTSGCWGIKISVTGFKLLSFCRWMLTSIWLSVSLDFQFALTMQHTGQLVGTDLRTRTLGFTVLPPQFYLVFLHCTCTISILPQDHCLSHVQYAQPSTASCTKRC